MMVTIPLRLGFLVCQGSVAEDRGHVVNERQRHHRVTNACTQVKHEGRVEGRVPSDKLWVKFGGGGSFKMSFQ